MNLKKKKLKFIKWIEQCFIVEAKLLESLEKKEKLDLSFVNLNTGVGLEIHLYSIENGKCILKTDSMEIAGDIIQDLLSFLNMQDLDSLADFPVEMENFTEVLKKIKDCQSAKNHIVADIAEKVNSVKSFVVRAEDSRIIKKMFIFYIFEKNLN